MIRILNVVQGLVSLFLIVVASLFGWPVWIAIIGLLVPIAISLFIVLILKEVSSKGKTRETIELLCGLFVGVGGLLFWAFEATNPSLASPMPLWLAIAGVPSMLFNLSYYVAWIFWFFGLVFGYAQEILEFVSGETVRAR